MDEVTVLARDPGKLTINHPRLTVRRGQLCDVAAVRDVAGYTTGTPANSPTCS